MDKSYTYYFILIALTLQFKGYHTACDTASFPATYTWPLGEGIHAYEMNTSSWTDSRNNIGYSSGPATLDYNAIEFNALNNAYIEFPVLDNADIGGDYAISFHVYVVGGGVFLHYKSDDFANNSQSGFRFKSIKLAVSSGNITVAIGNGYNETQKTTDAAIVYNQWNHVVFQRDVSKLSIKFAINDAVEQTDFDLWIKDAVTSFPGTLRLGGSMDGDGFFTGRVTCVQIIPCKNPSTSDTYQAMCQSSFWQTLITSTSTTATTTPTTSTTTPPTTTTTKPTSTTTWLTPFAPPLQIRTNCNGYKATMVDVSFSVGVALQDAVHVADPRACFFKCSTHIYCWSFVFKFGSCWLGPSSPGTVFDAGSVMYELA